MLWPHHQKKRSGYAWERQRECGVLPCDATVAMSSAVKAVQATDVPTVSHDPGVRGSLVLDTDRLSRRSSVFVSEPVSSDAGFLLWVLVLE